MAQQMNKNLSYLDSLEHLETVDLGEKGASFFREYLQVLAEQATALVNVCSIDRLGNTQTVGLEPPSNLEIPGQCYQATESHQKKH